MLNKSIFFLVLFFAGNLLAVNASEDDKKSYDGQINDPDEIQAYIQYYLKDSYDFTFFKDGKTGKYKSFPLPVILWDEGLKVFMSSKFEHGKAVAESGGNYYKVHRNNIYKTDASGTISLDEEGKVLNTKPFDMSITKSVFGTLLAGFIMFLMFTSLARGYKKSQVPTGFARVLEPLVIYVRDEIAIPSIGKKKYRKYMSFLLTVFFLIWILNLLGLTPLGFNVTGNIAVTICLALFTFFIVQFTANKDYWKHIFWMPGVPVPMKILMMPIEILGMLTKPFSLMLRLFANITAGNIVLMSLISLYIILQVTFGPVMSTGLSLILSTFIMIIKVLVAFLQAYIFTMLSALFIGLGVAEHEHH